MIEHDPDGELFRALLTIVYLSQGATITLGHYGTQVSEDVIVIRNKVYRTHDQRDRHTLIDYAHQLLAMEANTPIPPLPESTFP